MAKLAKNSPKKAAELFERMIKASVSGNPKPKEKRKTKKAAN